MAAIAERINYLLWKYDQKYEQTDLDDFFLTLDNPHIHAVADKQLDNHQIGALSTPSVHQL